MESRDSRGWTQYDHLWISYGNPQIVVIMHMQCTVIPPVGITMCMHFTPLCVMTHRVKKATQTDHPETMDSGGRWSGQVWA